ncbi:MAG: hypothetical protein M3P30_14640 [Chloroflexota bacterium]|nr:hypothetical protein [Chloroflexota bacterium]
MKHATPVVLDALEPLLERLRKLDGLTERKRGVFYRRSSAFLHFHEDPAGFFADVRIGPAWQRLPATTAAQRRALVDTVRKELASARR